MPDTMDAAEDDQDILLQRTSPELLAELQRSLESFLWKTTRPDSKQIRRRVRVRETDRLVNLLEPFQELPQLLDPHLDKLVPVLADAFVAFLRSPASRQASPTSQLLTPLSNGICRLLYTFCKIRGEKIILRFFSTEMRHLELLLSALEQGHTVNTDPANPIYVWEWEERYITLLWLSQLLLAPFDLSSISSAGTSTESHPVVPGLVWPSDTPGVALRVIPLAIHYLSSSGKERDAAKSLLVRVSMRKDMQEIGILQALVHWSLSCLDLSDGDKMPDYFYIGVLSYLAGILSSSISTKDMQSYLSAVFERIQSISNDNPAFKAIYSLAIARKTTIKVIRTISILTLQEPENMDADVVAESIATLIESLSDQATPVRLAASKALSMITLKLDPDLAVQVIEAVMECLQVNVTWILPAGGSRKRRDMSRVNPFEWHGLILTLSHLLYRHSPPASSLPEILTALILGLSFEQRSSTGASVGTNVRDAACFGIWALARRYKTFEIQDLKLSSKEGSSEIGNGLETSTLQALATVLVVSGTLDPAGNIRRGSSAALQELIGRHPDIIAEGIPIVQTVDYHAVALRSRAVGGVAVQAAHLSDHYHFGFMDELLGWRGVQDSDANVRRNIANTVGILSWAKRFDLNPATGRSILCETIVRISNQLTGLAVRAVEETHGLLLCLASILEQLRPALLDAHDDSALATTLGSESLVSVISQNVPKILSILNGNFSHYRHQELIAEAASRLVLASYPVIRKDCGTRSSMAPKSAGNEIVNENESKPALPMNKSPEAIQLAICADRLLLNPSLALGSPSFNVKSALDDIDLASTFPIAPNPRWLAIIEQLLQKFMPLNNSECVEFVADAAADLLLLLPRMKREAAINTWNRSAGETGRSTSNQGRAYIHTLFRILPIAATANLAPKILSTLKQRWQSGRIIESQVTILKCLGRSSALFDYTSDFVDVIIDGLDNYTTTARGDVGSFVRIEAVKVVGTLWRNGSYVESERLFSRTMRLAAEKLDKVRLQGRLAVMELLVDSDEAARLESLVVSSAEYFALLLAHSLPTSSHLLKTPSTPTSFLQDLLEGYVTSADTGSEDIICSSRAALSSFCLASPANNVSVFHALSAIIKAKEGEDRILVSALEVLSFLGEVCGWNHVSVDDLRLLFLRTQKAHFKTSNIKKLEASIKIYGCMIQTLSPTPPRTCWDKEDGETTNGELEEVTKEEVEEKTNEEVEEEVGEVEETPNEEVEEGMGEDKVDQGKKQELLIKVKDKLCSMLLHPFPRVRERVVEELWVHCAVGKGTDLVRAGKEEVRALRELVLSASQVGM